MVWRIFWVVVLIPSLLVVTLDLFSGQWTPTLFDVKAMIALAMIDIHRMFGASK